MSSRRVIACGAILALALGACKEPPKPPGEPKKPAADTVAKMSENLPAGRYQIPTKHTPAPDFYITLPRGYSVKNMSRMPNDEFFFIRSDDPSANDSTAVTPGFMRLYVGVNAQTAIEKGTTVTERHVMVGRMPLVWKLWSEKLPDGGIYYQREITSDDYFANLSHELAHAPLHLHIYVAGRDSNQVAELMTAAASLSITR
jgi:hypothetical protein